MASDATCPAGQEYWYERTAYRKIEYSSCEGGMLLDRGAKHPCPGIGGHGFFWWFFVLFIPVAFAALIGFWLYRRHGMQRGYARLLVPFSPLVSSSFEFSLNFSYHRAIRLPSSEAPHGSVYLGASRESDFLDTLASVPWFVIGIAGIAWDKLRSSRLPFVGRDGPGWARNAGYRPTTTGGYRTIPIDEDAQVLRFEDEE